MLSKPEPQLWVGSFEDGEIVVFDPQLQKSNEPDWVYLWSRDTKKTERYAKDFVKKAIRKNSDAAEGKAVLEIYVRARDARKIEAQSKAVFNHREFLERLGIKYLGTRTAGAHAPRFIRTPWCWNCKSGLDNRIQLECEACGWILCECGACGCGRNA